VSGIGNRSAILLLAHPLHTAVSVPPAVRISGCQVDFSPWVAVLFHEFHHPVIADRHRIHDLDGSAFPQVQSFLMRPALPATSKAIRVVSKAIQKSG